MKLSEQWLRQWVDPPVDTDALAAQLTNAGLEVDSVTPAAVPLDGVVVGEILSVEPHPGADKLSVCEVSTGGETHVVVCGAPNVHSGMRAPYARVGAKLPGGTKIRRTKIRGVESHGMLCSADELQIGDDADGILDLGPDAPVGAALSDVLGAGDVCIDIDLTPNRGDCLSVAGVAREVAALNALDVQPVPNPPVAKNIEDGIEIGLEAPVDCPRYVGRVIRDIDPKAKTPLWMRERLRRSGLRAISPVVDVTNYVMMELGQPMHAFDLDTLEGGIRVRRGTPGESLELLDGGRIDVDGESLVIADHKRAVALAGIMGGLATAVTHESRNILLESAWFLPKTIAVEARRQGLQTDSSHRFERGVAPDLQARASERATALLLDIVGGRPGPVVDAQVPEALPPRPAIPLRVQRLALLLGAEVAKADVEAILRRLGMQVEATNSGWQITPPPHRSDVTIEADLIEEVARVRGYDQIPDRPPEGILAMSPRTEARIGLDRLRQALTDRGYQEAITYSFVDPGLQAELDPNAAPIPLSNPISSDLAVMRTSMWPGLFAALLHNVRRQQNRVRLFESGLTFRQSGNAIEQKPRIGGIVMGPVAPEQWGRETLNADFFDLKSDVEALLGFAAASEVEFVPDDHPALHPGQAARVIRAGEAIGRLGALHPGNLKRHKLSLPVLVFELDLDSVQAGQLPKFEALSRYPAVRRDIAVVVDESITAKALRDCVGQAAGDVLKNLELFDVYRGEGIDSGKKSLALKLTFQDPSRTLNDEEIDAAEAAIVDALAKNLGGSLRG
ncbi:MAG TPA: phenylalanine--tRNA ligase subunit beta [Gammaproteobacteria bacterium]|nr:phenylalanine--tRNA ligase subunit beta [Gammaproteobacteria bacterium]